MWESLVLVSRITLSMFIKYIFYAVTLLRDENCFFFFFFFFLGGGGGGFGGGGF